MNSKILIILKSGILFIIVMFLTTQCELEKAKKLGSKEWFPKYKFDPKTFEDPPQEFGPLARWWWPGNDVTKKELKREIKLFANHGFAGVEVQTLSFSLPDSLKESERVLGWDTPEYYNNLRIVMKEARKRGLIVDLTNGSGWPTGGPYLDKEDGFLTLDFISLDIEGGKNIELDIPETNKESGVPSRLETVLAVKIIPNESDRNLQPISLDPLSTQVITDKVKNNKIFWSAPDGKWKIIVFWSKPNSIIGSMVTASKQGPVLNHLDSLKVIKNYNHLFGQRTGLQPYFGNPMRAVFTDSYEFSVHRHYSRDFLSFFKEKRGYDISPWLPVNMQTGYNYALWKNPNSTPKFSFGNVDWRIKYDYDLTISELFQKHFIEVSSKWMEKRDLLFRNQGYGMKLDMIAIAGYASIPETESMLGSESNLKIMTSGAHLYNRPIISAESVVFANRAYMTTPQKTRIAVDKLFAAGVNQIVFHGIPYRFISDETMPIGWNPFCSSGINFSSDFGEGNIFWKYQKEINEYITRTQYTLSLGKSHADVLIYYPFMEIEGMPDNPEELLAQGYLKDVEPPLPRQRISRAVKNIAADKSEWAKTLYPIINQLEENGITWDWVNDQSIQIAELDTSRQINIRENRYQALILPDISVIEMKSAEQINSMTNKGMNLLVVGSIPDKQPSFLDWEVNDQITKNHITQAISSTNSTYIVNGEDISMWFQTLSETIRFNDKYQFIRQVKRDMTDGSRIQFIWNMSDEWQRISLNLNSKYKHAYWLNAETGKITCTELANNSNTIVKVIPPYNSIILYASTTNKIADRFLSNPEATVYNAEKVITIDNWNLKVDTIEIYDTLLFDWKKHEHLKFSSKEGIYNAIFQLDEIDTNSDYIIDLGKVYFTAEVILNGKSAGSRIYAPYCLDISSFLRKGENKIKICITPCQLNGLIGHAATGNKRYKAFQGKENNLMSVGLIGPVTLYKK